MLRGPGLLQLLDTGLVVLDAAVSHLVHMDRVAVVPLQDLNVVVDRLEPLVDRVEVPLHLSEYLDLPRGAEIRGTTAVGYVRIVSILTTLGHYGAS